MSYIVLVMHPQPKNISHIFMTAIGLVMLVMALVLNHKHPHNEGIATMPHNSIYHLELTVSQAPDQVAGFGFEGGIAPRPQENPADAPPAPATDEQKALIITASTTSVILSSANQCQAIAESALSTDAGSQAELKIMDNAYSDNQSAIMASACTPSQTTPAASDR